MNIIDKVQQCLDSMTKSEHKIATYFLTNPYDFAFLTLDCVAAKMAISTTSVIRFCRRLGLSGYKALQDEVRSSFKYELTLPDKFEKNIKSQSFDLQLTKTLKNSVNCIEKTFNNLSASDISTAVYEIANAKRVFCFGMKESFALSHYAYTRFLTIRPDVFMLSSGQNGEIESLLSLNKDDVCIFFLFHRYTKQSKQILEHLKKQGISVVLITSPPYDEIKDNATVLLPCFVNINGIKNSAIASVCIIDHLCNAVVTVCGSKALDHMEKSEILFKKFTF